MLDEVRIVSGASVEAVAADLLSEVESETVTPAQPAGAAAPKRNGKKRGRKPGQKNGTGSKAGQARPAAASIDGQQVRSDFTSAGQDIPPAPAAKTPEQEAAEFAAEVEFVTPLIHLGMGAFIDRKFPDEPYQIEEAARLAPLAVQLGKKHAAFLAAWGLEIATAATVFVQVAGRSKRAQERAYHAQRGAPAGES